jgi:ADP-heptose:LPS heptosyltransferase
MMLRARSPAVIVSPFANERVRQWPSRYFRELIEIILREDALPVAVVGSREQRTAANDIIRGLSSEWALNVCGRWSWAELEAAVEVAPYVVGNNSGVVHLAAARGRSTLCLFSGSHAFNEWMPRGPGVVVVMKPLPCSPCGPGDERCPNGLACLRELRPPEAFARFREARPASSTRPDA